MKPMKLLLVSDYHHFSTMDVFEGYKKSFEQMGINFMIAPMHEMVLYYSQECCNKILLSDMLNKDLDFTHVLFISGGLIPDFIFKSKYDKKIGVIATDDPHAAKILLNKKEYIDYYFTNEKRMENEDENIFYVPVATDSNLPVCAKSDVPEEMQSDVAFVGTIYKSRIKPLEIACKWCEENGKTIKIFAPHVPETSEILKKYTQEGIVPNHVAKLIYRGANVVLNLDRDIKWHPSYGNNDNPVLNKEVKTPYSLNPRAYEIAGCRSPQLFVHPRKEAKDLFGDSAWYAKNNSEIEGKLTEIFNIDADDIQLKLIESYNVISQNHLYLHRASQILNIIKGVDCRE